MNATVSVKVKTNIKQRDYTYEGYVERLKYRGLEGIIVKEHSGHGKCYDVKFRTGTATYDPNELTLV